MTAVKKVVYNFLTTNEIEFAVLNIERRTNGLEEPPRRSIAGAGTAGRQGRKRCHDQRDHRREPARFCLDHRAAGDGGGGLGAVPRFLEIFARLDPRPAAHTRFDVVSHPEIFDGVRVHKGQVLAVIRHNARVLLSCERVILNLMQHLSGIATLTRQYVDAIQGTKARVLDTRKTVPGLRALEKYAVLCGGGTNHRLDLSSGILIKNNHISLGGGLRTALTNALEKRKPGNRVQVEVRTQKELEEAIECGAEAILLDNMSPAQVQRSRLNAFAKKTAGFRLRRRGALCSTTFAPTPKQARTSSALARSRTPPRPQISR